MSAIFETAFLPHAALPDELAFEDTWHLEVRTLTVSTEIGKLRNPSSGWHEMFGDRWLGAVPALHATITAGIPLEGSGKDERAAPARDDAAQPRAGGDLGTMFGSAPRGGLAIGWNG